MLKQIFLKSACGIIQGIPTLPKSIKIECSDTEHKHMKHHRLTCEYLAHAFISCHILPRDKMSESAGYHPSRQPVDARNPSLVRGLLLQTFNNQKYTYMYIF